MCFGKRKSSGGALPSPTAIKPRQDFVAALPQKKDVVDDDETADVTYGSKRKKTSPANTNRQGAAALKIKLNIGNQTGTNTGGLNV
mgnify:CR=1 FL=1